MLLQRSFGKTMFLENKADRLAMLKSETHKSLLGFLATVKTLMRSLESFEGYTVLVKCQLIDEMYKSWSCDSNYVSSLVERLDRVTGLCTYLVENGMVEELVPFIEAKHDLFEKDMLLCLEIEYVMCREWSKKKEE